MVALDGSDDDQPHPQLRMRGTEEDWKREGPVSAFESFARLEKEHPKNPLKSMTVALSEERFTSMVRNFASLYRSLCNVSSFIGAGDGGAGMEFCSSLAHRVHLRPKDF